MGSLFYRGILTLASVVHTTRRAFIPSPRHIGAAPNSSSKSQVKTPPAPTAADEGSGYPCFSFFMPQTPEQRGIRRELVDTGNSGQGIITARDYSEMFGEEKREADGRDVDGEKQADKGKRE